MDDDMAISIMKLDAIKLSDKKPSRSRGSNALKALEQRLRKFFDEADGHGSLMRKPPETMMTAQYFKIASTGGLSCYPIKRMDWIAFVNSANYKKKFSKANDQTVKIERAKPTSIHRPEKTNSPKIT